ncbi:MAG: LysR family transcriptional regulator [Geminicoccaceae bacterium]|nr:LysR family transcriptional regulator [Geminicoccaceae bacterium]
MEMHQIRYFLAVCETLNFTRAAERCNVTQPALTRAVQKLEEEFGGLLFRRERHLSHLTDLGRLMRPKLEQIWQETEAAKSTARSFLKLDDAELIVGVMCTIGPLRGIGFLNDFQHAHPGIGLTLREGVPSMLAGLLREGALDVAIMAQAEPFEERFDVHPLYRERFVVAFPPGHRFAAQNGVRVADIRDESYLSRVNCEYRDHLGALCAEHGFSPRYAYRSEREDWIQIMVAAGMGICFIPEFSVTTPGVVARPVVDPEVVREVSLVSVAGRRFSPAVARFVRAIRSYPWPTPAGLELH